MSPLANAAGKFADKLVELLEVFDLSFFVSGAVAVGAGAMMFGVTPFDLAGIGITTAALLVVIAYFAGLLCFAIGRWVRASVFGLSLEDFAKRAGPLRDVAQFSDLFFDGELRAGQERQLYDRLWVLLRTLPELSESFALVKRYWVLSATFDGLMVAVLLWNAPLFLVADIAIEQKIVLAILGVALSGFSLRQANEYRSYQGAELVATARQWEALYGEQRRLDRDKAEAEIALTNRTTPT